MPPLRGGKGKPRHNLAIPFGVPYAVIRAYPLTHFLSEMDKPLTEEVGETRAMELMGRF